MKKLLAVFFLCAIFGSCHICLGAPPKTAFSPDPAYQSYDGVYSKLGFGSTAEMTRFMTNQISRIKVGIYQENGAGGFGPSYSVNESETLDEAILRVSTTEFRRVLNANHYNISQKFGVALYLQSEVRSQFFAPKVMFTPEQGGMAPAVPNTILNSLRPTMVSVIGGLQSIYWNNIIRASLVVLTPNGSLVYAGDSATNSVTDTNMFVVVGQELCIAHRFLTNGYTGVLTIALNDGTSATYRLEDGNRVVYMQDVKPLISLPDLRKIGAQSPIVVSISGGGPNYRLTLNVHTDFNCPAQRVTIDLDEVGSGKWTCTNRPAMLFFSTAYYDQ